MAWFTSITARRCKERAMRPAPLIQEGNRLAVSEGDQTFLGSSASRWAGLSIWSRPVRRMSDDCSGHSQEADMRLVATEYVSLDGVLEEPGQWSFPFFNDEARQFKWNELQASDALLLGRKTYEGFAAAWPTMTDTGEFGEKMSRMT